MIVADIWSRAKKIDHYEIYTGVADVYWVSTTHFTVACPTNKRWWLQGGVVNRDVNGTLDARIFNGTGKPIYYLSSKAAGTGLTGYPDTGTGAQNARFILDATDYVDITFGAAQGAGAYASCVVLEIDRGQ